MTKFENGVLLEVAPPLPGVLLADGLRFPISRVRVLVQFNDDGIVVESAVPEARLQKVTILRPGAHGISIRPV